MGVALPTDVALFRSARFDRRAARSLYGTIRMGGDRLIVVRRRPTGANPVALNSVPNHLFLHVSAIHLHGVTILHHRIRHTVTAQRIASGKPRRYHTCVSRRAVSTITMS
jgi:hypothetical protein